jgi:type VI protein secretion system component Hcp
MPLDAFLQFDAGSGVAAPKLDGETQDKIMKAKSPVPFDISNWSFAIKQDVSIGSGAGGIGAGKVSFDPFKVTKQIDNASSTFFKTCCTGGHYEKAHLMIRKAGSTGGGSGSGDIYLQFDFLMLFVSNVSWSHNDPTPQEEITFDYGALQVNYKPQVKSGALESNFITTAWNRVKNNSSFILD